MAPESAAGSQSPTAPPPVIPQKNATPATMKSVQETPPAPREKPALAEFIPRALHLTLSQNILGVLCYLLGWVTGILFLAVGRENKFVLFHAWQSIIVGAIATLVMSVFFLLPPVQEASIAFWSILASEYVFGAAAVLLWLFLMLHAYRGRTKTLPFPGEPALKLSKLLPA